jgi:hypothetical protein
MTEERSSESKTKLLTDIEKDSETLKRLLDLLAALSIDVQIVSIYEELQTPSVVKVSLDNVFNEVHIAHDYFQSSQGAWSDTGIPETMVEESSAVLNLPFEVKIPAAADHRRIVKHIYRDQRYHQIKEELSKLITNDRNDGRQRSVLSKGKLLNYATTSRC